MKFLFIICFSFALFFLSCKERNSEFENKKVAIYGYWKSQNIDYGVDKKPLILIIKDTFSSFLIPRNHGIFKRVNKHFNFKSTFYSECDLNFDLNVQGENQMLLCIRDSASLEKVKSLILANNNFLFDYKKFNCRHFNSIVFYRLEKKNNKRFSEIFFKSGYGNGIGNIFYLKIQSNGKISYFGQKETKLMKGYKSFLKNKDITNLNKVINLLKVEKISQEYIAPWTDDQKFELRIKFTDGTQMKTSVYGFYNEPVELRSLISEILSLPKSLILSESPELKLDSFNGLN